MPEMIFEVKPIQPIWCIYPGCETLHGTVRRATWLIRRIDGPGDWQPVCSMCKARMKAMLGAGELSGEARR